MRRIAAYVLAIVAVAFAVAVRRVLDPVLGDSLPLVTLFGAVAAAVWVGGARPAAIAVLGGYVACQYLFIPPRGHFNMATAGDLVGFLVYLVTCAFIIAFGEAMRSAQMRASEGRQLLQVTLQSIGDAVITTDIAGRITYLNEVAEALTGWPSADARTQPLEAVFRIVNETTRQPVENPAARALREGTVVGLANHTVLIRRDLGECPIDDSAAPIRNDRGEVSGCVLIFRDVTSQRTVERDKAAQLMTARFLASIIESSNDAIISKSLEGEIRSWNTGAERLFGYSAAQAIGRHISLVIPPERIAEEEHIIASLKAGQRIEHFETERLHADGSRLLVSLTISPIKDDGGQVIGASKIVRDVTRQRQAEERERRLLEEAAAANAKFHAFFEQGALFAGIMNLDGTLLDANRLSWEACGYTREQCVGKPFWQGPWWAPSEALVAQIRDASVQAAAGEPYRTEMPYYVADGSERMVDFAIQPIKDSSGRVLFLAPTGTDITDRKRIESEREMFVTLVENSTDFVGICDLQGVPFYINRAGLTLVGLDDLAAARRTHVQDFFFPEDQPRITGAFFQTVLSEGHGEVEIRFRNFKTGEARWMAYKVVALRGDHGQAVAIATVSQDVTERRRLEDDLRKLAEDLASADRRKDEFLATLAHELRNPLAPLVNMLEVWKRANGDSDVLARAQQTMERQLGQLVRLVDDLLDLNRITHNRLELRKAPITLSAVIQQAVESSRPLIDAAGHQLLVALPSEDCHLYADAARLAQVFGNLLNNSCKYTKPGGRISITGVCEDDDVVVTIADNGAGIPAEKLDSVFDMFMQVDSSVERSQGGLGIGLTLVRRLVEMHGGAIDARSAGEGRGSQFIVRLPREVGEQPGSAGSPGDATPSMQALRILVVDDNNDSALSLSMLLEIMGHEIQMAHDGVKALDAIEARRPDVVLLDIGLPRLSGYDVCRRVRQEPWGDSVVIIALTGWGQDEDRRKTREAGFDGHLVKPVDYAELVRLLRTLTPVVKTSGPLKG